ncbi:constitutive coactivator of peroxisome proliferator-activated receptor gamma-like [Convolutriloba macropyga]|uniref:constitutive coactivator of peroxisome proliferator-activated receptor gamma-like n=1 Tax=Convolutriloba macropyga TaxID=536237 RepID=UPI003F5205CA
MGVKGLQSYMENNCGGKVCYRVNINQVIKEFREETTSTEVLILVDANSSLRHLLEGLDWMCGGQYNEYSERIHRFVNSIRDAGAEPIFFYDGPCLTQKRDEWIKRRVENYHRVQHLMNRIRTGECVAEVSAFILPTGISMFQRFILTEECKCKVIVTSEECDEEIALYAKQNPSKVVAIMAQDSDFVIYNAAKYYLSAQHLDLNDLSTRVYSSCELAKVNKLDPRWLPVVATLLGNDYLSQDSLRKFHFRITNWRRSGFPRHQILIPAVAKVISEKLTIGMSVEEMSSLLNREVFMNSATSQTENAIRSSLNSFLLLNVTGNTKQITDSYGKNLLDALMLHSNFNPMAAQVLVHSCVEHSNAFEDLTSQFKATALVYEPINSRYMGILRKHQEFKPGKNVIQEFSVWSEHSVKRARNVPVVFPPFEVDLLSLTQSADPTLISEKLKVLLWGITGKNVIDEQSFQSDLERLFLRINPKFYICSLVLYYLHQIEQLLNLTEVELFVSMFVILDSELYEFKHQIRAYPNYNAIHLATLFNRGIQAVGRIISILGPIFPSFSFSQKNFFDGVLFQKIFLQEIKIDKASESDRAKSIRSAIFDFMNFKV